MDTTDREPTRQILVLPALGVPAHVYAPLLAALDALPGTASTLVPEPAAGARLGGVVAARHHGYLARVLALEALVEQRRRAAPACQVLLLGHSIGGHFALLVLARRVVAVDGVLLVASGTPHWRAFEPAAQPRMRRGLAAIATVLRLLPWYPGDWLGFGGRQPRQLMHDWLGLARTGRFDAMAGLAGTDRQLQQARGPVLAVGIAGDALAPPEATRQLLALAPGLDVLQQQADSERLLRESPERRHNLWPRDPQAVLPSIRQWLDALPAGAPAGP